MKQALRLSSGTILAVALLASARPVLAQQTDWQNGGDSLWSNSDNWFNGVPTSTSLATFDTAGSTTVDLGNASRDLLSLIFNSGAQGYTFSGNTNDKLNFAADAVNAKIYSASTLAQTIITNLGLNSAFTITNDIGAGLLTLNGSITSASAGLLTVNGDANTTLGGVVSLGTSGLTKSGLGTLTLGAANSYTGTTTITGGTLNTTGGDGRIGTGALLFGDTTTPTTTVGAVSLAGNETVSSLTVATDSTTANTLTIGAGKTLTVNGAFAVGVANKDINTSFTATGGSLNVSNTSGDVNLGFYTAGGSGVSTTVDLTGLTSFTANLGASASRFNVGSPTSPTARTVSSEVTLSNGTNTITANSLSIADSSGQLQTGNSNLFLGNSTNIINTNTLVIGSGIASGTMRKTTVAGSGTLALNGKTGAGSKVAITIANKTTTSGTNVNNTSLNLTGLTATVNASTVKIGHATAVGTNSGSSGSLTFTAGTFNADSLDLGNNSAPSGGGSASGTLTVSGGSFTSGSISLGTKSGASSATGSGGLTSGNGTINLSGGSFTVNSGSTVTMGTRATAGAATATINITGGVFTSNVDIKQGTGSNITSTLTLDGTGTLDMKGKSIGIVGGLITNRNFNAGTLMNVAGINNGAGLTKSTGGTLTLAGANSFTGPVAVNGGVLNLQTSSQLNLGSVSSNLSVNDSTLGITAFSTGVSAVVSTGGTVTFGLSTGSTINLNLIGTPTAALISTTGAFNVNGSNTINFTTTAPIATGDYKIVDYNTGAGIGGATGFGGLTIGTMPFRTTITKVDNTIAKSFDIHVESDPIRWDGTSDEFWDINTTSNWKQIVSLTPATYQEPSPPTPGEAVTFDDAAAGNYDITASQAVNPISMTFNNNSQAYSFDGAGIKTNTININGSGNVSVTGGNFTGTGTLTKGGSGTLEFSNSGAILSLAPSVTINTGTVAFNRTDDLTGAATITSSITGTGGTLLKQNSNIVALSGDNSAYSGISDVAAGTLRIAGPTALMTTTVQNNATLQFDLGTGGSTSTGGGSKAVSIIGNGVSGIGALVASPTSGTADVNAHIGALTLNGDARIAATASVGTGPGRLFVDGAITGGGFNLHAVVDRISNTANEIDLVNNGTTNLNNVTITGNGAMYIGKNTDLGATGEIILGDGSTGGQLGIYTGGSPDALSVALNKPIKVASASVGGIAAWYNPALTIGSPITIDGTRFEVVPYVRSSNTTGRVTLAGDITGAGGLAPHLDANATTSRLGLVELTSDNNTYAGPTVIGGGGGLASVEAANDRITLSIGNGGATGSIGTAGVTVNALGTLQFNRNNALNFAHTITGGGNIAQAGSGTTTVTGNNTYTGSTTVANGTLIKGAATSIGSGPLVFGGDQTSTIGNLDLTTFDQTVSSLTARSNSTTPNTINIASGKKLTVTGPFTVGVAGADINTALTASGGGTLEVNNTSADVNLGLFTATGVGGGLTATTDLKGLAAFKADVANFFIAAHPAPTARTVGSVVYLSNTSNEITATKLSISDTNGTAMGADSFLYLGDGATTINTDTLIVGQGNGRGRMRFENAAGSLVLNGKGGAGTKVAITIGNKSQGTTNNGASSDISLAGHTATVDASTLTIGRQSAADTDYTGTLNFGGGTFNVDTIDIANRSGSGDAEARGRLNVSGGTFTVNPGGSVTMGTFAGASSLASSDARLTITGGIVTVNGSILQGATTGTGALNSVITVGAAGTLNTVGTGGVGAIAIGTGVGATGTFTIDGGSVHAAGPIQMGLDSGGTGTFVMNSGTVTCDDWVVMGTFGTGIGHGTQHGGTINTVNFDVAQDTGSSGDYTMDNANSASQIIASGFFAVGDGGTGTFDLNAGTTSSGEWTYVGLSGMGTFNIGNGTHTAGDNFNMGGAEFAVGNVNMITSSNAVINITGNAVPYTGNLVVGDHGSGNLTVSTGTINMNASDTSQNTLNSATTSVANHSGDPPNYLDDARDGNLSIAEEEGTGIVNLSGDGVINVAANVFVGGFNTHDTQANYLRGGNGTLNISGGELHVGVFSGAGSTGGDLVLGSPDALTSISGVNSQAAVTLSGGTLDVAHGTGSIVSGGAANTSFTFNGGTLKVKVWNPTTDIGGDLGNLVQNGNGSLLDVTGNNTTINGSYDLGEGTATIGAGRTLTANNVLNSFGAGVINVGTGPGFPAGDHNQNGVVDAADYVLWSMTPGAFPDGYNVWRGNFGATGGGGGPASLTVGSGSVNVDTLNFNNGSVTAGGGVTVMGNPTSPTTPSLTIDTDAAGGTGTINGDLTLGDDGVLEIEIGSLSSFDKLVLSGTHNLNFDGDLQLVFLNSFDPPVSSTYDILDFTGHTGTFDNIIAPAGTWDVNYSTGVLTRTAAASGNVMGAGASVPEPMTGTLVVLGIAGMAGLRSRRRRRG